MIRLLVTVLACLLFAPAAVAAPSYADQADAMLRSYAAADAFSGAVLVAKDGKPIFRKAYGMANREWDVPATPETVFRLGSITKQFTAAAILQLAEQGKLSLDDPISKYYAAAPAAWAPVTLKHLLTHTSGIPSYTAIPGFFGAPSRVDLKPEEIVALTRDKPLEFTPGSKFNYDNTGYILLGVVIEKVSGQTYATYLQDHIFGPLGLKHSGFDVSETILPKRAAGYERRGPRVINTPYLAMSLPYAAGSLYSTVDDLLAWDVALRSGKVVSPASVAAMFTDYGFGYGFGQSIQMRDGKRYWNHNGGINGFSTILARYPDDGLTLVVLANLTSSDPGRIADRLGEFYFHPDHAIGPFGPPKAAELDRYVGHYRLTDTYAFDVTREGSRLFFQPTGGTKAELFREMGRTFFGPAVAPYVEFGDGPKATELKLQRGRQTQTAKRVD